MPYCLSLSLLSIPAESVEAKSRQISLRSTEGHLGTARGA